MAAGARVHAGYEALLADPDVDAVYIPLVNSLHREWTIKALAAGKHVLCEKPLAMSAGEAEEMAAAARDAGRLLMEALMYRFHPRINGVVAAARQDLPPAAWISFGFPMRQAGNYRAVPELGGGALYDVGCYCVSLARWLFGEPELVRVDAARVDGVDWTLSATLGFPESRRAFLFMSLDSPEVQELRFSGLRLEQPFTASRDPEDPYQLMVEAFSRAVLAGDRVAPLTVEESIANLRVIDRLRGLLGLQAG